MIERERWKARPSLYNVAVLMGLLLGLTTGISEAETNNVTLYGRAVSGFDWQNRVLNEKTGHSHSMSRMAGNQWGTSLFGLTGREDLGSGTEVGFRFESGMSLNAGAWNGDNMWNRRAYLRISSAGYGTLKFGKNQPVADAVWAIDPTGQQFIGTATLVRGRNWAGDDNIIYYKTPNFNGASVWGFWTLNGEHKSRDRKAALALSYDRGEDSILLMYDTTRDRDGRYSDIWTHSKELTVGGALKVGSAKLFAAYENLNAPRAAAPAASNANHVWFGARYAVTPSWTMIGSIFRIVTNRHNGSANLFMLGSDYKLSKRTLLYASIGSVQNSDGANFSVEATNNNPRAGHSQQGFYLGLVYAF